MEKLIVTGGNRLEGTVALSGAKNSALKAVCASILASGQIRLFNMPTKMQDVRKQINLLKTVGAKVCIDNDMVTIDSSTINEWDVHCNEDESVRTTLLMLGSLLGRFGKARVPLPGGCKIGERKYDLHIYALERLGARIRVTDDGFLVAECDGLKGTEIEFPIRTTGGTENAMIAASLAKGVTTIKNAHTRPEVTDLANFLNAMGAKIRIVGSGWIEVEGVDGLYGTNYRIIPDGVEALTFIIASAVTGGDVEVLDCPLYLLEVPMVYLRESGVRFHKGDESVRVTANRKLTALDISTGPYPGINSDFQPLFAAYATKAQGISRITDIRFKDRFDYISELLKMGASISREGNTITIVGGRGLKGSCVNAHDLRAGAALLIAALFAEGKTEIDNVYQIDRGYEAIEEKLRKIGANTERALEK